MAVAFVAAGTTSADVSTTRAVNIPSHSSGDLLILHIHIERFDGTGAVTSTSRQMPTIDSGWRWLLVQQGKHVDTSEYNHTQDKTLALAYKFGNGSETSVTVTNAASTDPFVGKVSAWSGVDSTRPFDVVGVTHSAATGSVVVNGVTTTVDNAVVVGFTGHFDNGSISAVSDSTAYTLTTTAGRDASMVCQYKTVATAGASGNMTWTSSISDRYIAAAVALNPSGGSPTGTQLMPATRSHTVNIGSVGNAVANMYGIDTDYLVVGLVAYDDTGSGAPTLSNSGTLLQSQSSPTGWVTELRSWGGTADTFSITGTPAASTQTVAIMLTAWMELGGTALGVGNSTKSTSTSATPSTPTITVGGNGGSAVVGFVFSGDDNVYSSTDAPENIARHNEQATSPADCSFIAVMDYPVAAGTSSAVTVTQNANGPDDTSLFTVVVLDAEPIDGTMAETLDDFTMSASGSVRPPVTGTSATTVDNFTMDAVGFVRPIIVGNMAVTLDDFTMDAEGIAKPTPVGTMAAILEDFTMGSAGASDGAQGVVNIDARPYTYWHYWRTTDGALSLVESTRRIRQGGWSTADGFEKVSERFRTNYLVARSFIESTVNAAWLANSGETAATLQTALHSALNSAGVKKYDGTTLS